MFVLNECSVCLEDYSTERAPHSITCGHVFCRSCLEQLATHTPNCPTCRVSYSLTSIRKISCAYQDPASNSRSNQAHESESDTILWQVVQSAVECPEDAGQRKSLLTLWSEQGVSEENLSENALASFALLNLLVHVEDSRQALEERLETAQAVEQSLCDRISSLETQLSETTVYPSARDFRSLISDFQKLQLAVDIIHKNTSDTTRRLSANTVAPPQPVPQEQIPAPSEGSSQPMVPQIPPGNTDAAIPIQAPQARDEPPSELNFSNNLGRASACFVPVPTVQAPNYTVRIIPPR